jgi:hypothetical protein
VKRQLLCLLKLNIDIFMDGGMLAVVGITDHYKYHCRSIVDDLIAQLEKREMEEGGREIREATQVIGLCSFTPFTDRSRFTRKCILFDMFL